MTSAAHATRVAHHAAAGFDRARVDLNLAAALPTWSEPSRSSPTNRLVSDRTAPRATGEHVATSRGALPLGAHRSALHRPIPVEQRRGRAHASAGAPPLIECTDVSWPASTPCSSPPGSSAHRSGRRRAARRPGDAASGPVRRRGRAQRRSAPRGGRRRRCPARRRPVHGRRRGPAALHLPSRWAVTRPKRSRVDCAGQAVLRAAGTTPEPEAGTPLE